MCIRQAHRIPKCGRRLWFERRALTTQRLLSKEQAWPITSRSCRLESSRQKLTTRPTMDSSKREDARPSPVLATRASALVILTRAASRTRRPAADELIVSARNGRSTRSVRDASPSEAATCADTFESIRAASMAASMAFSSVVQRPRLQGQRRPSARGRRASPSAGSTGAEAPVQRVVHSSEYHW
eukprot:5167859-Prymnesium_polylepis.1